MLKKVKPNVFDLYLRSLALTTSIDQIYYYNLEFFNLLLSNKNNPDDNLYNIQSVDELFKHFRNHLFKCHENSTFYAESVENSLKMYQIEIKVNRRNRFPFKIGSVRKSTSCPQLTKTNCCITAGCVHRCLFTSIQANVTQAFKNMDFDFDNKLTYVEFRKGIIGLLFGKDKLKTTTDTHCILSTINHSIRNEYLKCKFDTFVKCPIDEKLIFKLFLRFDKNEDGNIDFGKFFENFFC